MSQSAEGWGEMPWTCCGETFERRLEWAVHRTEAHDQPQQHLDYLEPGEFEAVYARADSYVEIADELGWGIERVLRVVGVYGLGGDRR